ncbi:N-formylglutamate amidohydrolase [Paracoccus sp. SMMA_5_TC]|uniref:N-formylglutamate amidohydrolase n=1 Tax=Paracoccus sp. SMMA_5_TC TaxID=2654280 RepID=UPI0012B31501|nr:N-formylglutamate amidohydrolase [Paracoccus sp. SMMA_5_TC]UXU80283.1 N-formylglutamate amidohydrolase [Paracoccus sp. SMMA_5_TC]
MNADEKRGVNRIVSEAVLIQDYGSFPALVENREAAGRIVLVCEHASCRIPEAWGGLGLADDAARAHVAWDPGALDLARGLAARLDACLVHAAVSRLVHDLNRSPDHPGAMPARSELFDIPGNATISPAERLARMRAVYIPFHTDLHGVIAQRLALGLRPVIVTIHSFTPVYFGQPRDVEFGIIHDTDDRFARAVLQNAPQAMVARLNQPYSAADGVTHTLRLHATPYGLAHAMLEIRNDLIATPAAAAAMADRLAPCLRGALADTNQGED